MSFNTLSECRVEFAKNVVYIFRKCRLDHSLYFMTFLANVVWLSMRIAFENVRWIRYVLFDTLWEYRLKYLVNTVWNVLRMTSEKLRECHSTFSGNISEKPQWMSFDILSEYRYRLNSKLSLWILVFWNWRCHKLEMRWVSSFHTTNIVLDCSK